MQAVLSPRELLARLSPGVGLDAAVVGEWLLSDCYRLSNDEPVRIELRHGLERIELQVEPTPERPQHRALASVAGLDIGYRSPAPADVGESACKRVAEHLRASLGDEPRRWCVAEPSLRELAEPIAAEIHAEPTTLAADLDHELLERDFGAYERLYGVRPRAWAVHVLDEPARGVSVEYPAPRNGRVPASTTLYPTSMRIAARRRMRRYFGRMGYVFDDDTVLRTVPTPRTYARVLAGRGDRAGVRPRMIAGVSASVLPVHWGMMVRRNLLPVSVAPSYSVAIHQRIRNIALLSSIPCDVGAVPHDMGLHAAALHAVPAEAWEQLLAQAFERLRRRPWRILAGRFGVLGRLAMFFEGPITTHCWRAWQEADEPEDFERCFAPHFRQLLDELREI